MTTIVGLAGAPGGSEFFANGNKVMALGATSYLHGAWTVASGGSVSSDARLKKEIVPLYKTLAAFSKTSKSISNNLLMDDSIELTQADKLDQFNKAVEESIKSTRMQQSAQYNTTM